jgi:predicted RNA-binding Zn-ribbon protein involved in translation (DUF1610 family)
MDDDPQAEALCSSCRRQELVKISWGFVCPDCDEVVVVPARDAER